MRRRIVEVNKAEVRRFRREAVMTEPAPNGCSATLGERAIARQIEGQTGRRFHVAIIDDPIKARP